MMKKWLILEKLKIQNSKFKIDDVIDLLLKNRGLADKKDIEAFLNPPDPSIPSYPSAKDIGIDPKSLKKGIVRIKKAIADHESIVVYADYDADGITAGAIMWETLHAMGGNVMPYIPHRVDEGYGLSVKGIDSVIEKYKPKLIITVDHGITAHEKVAYAQSKGIDVIVTDHHVKPNPPAGGPDCTIIHTTQLCGAGVSWFVCKELLSSYELRVTSYGELFSLAAIGTIADMVPLVGVNRSIVKYGLAALNQTKRVGLRALMGEARLTPGELHTYDVSHVIAPRLNAMGRLVHAMDALRLLCTGQKDKAAELAHRLALTNRERQTMTTDMSLHAKSIVNSELGTRNSELLFVAHESYNQGVIGLVAGKLVEEFYRPAIVLAKGELITKASARSIVGFNIVEAIRSCSDILVDVGGHPMAAGFTVETKHLEALQARLEAIAEKELDEQKLTRVLRIDMELPMEAVSEELWNKLQAFEPFGFGNPEPVFASRGVTVTDARLVGADGKHLKLRLASEPHFSHPSNPSHPSSSIDAIAFNFGHLYGELQKGTPIDIAYTIDMNVWNGNRKLQLKIKDIQLHEPFNNRSDGKL